MIFEIPTLSPVLDRLVKELFNPRTVIKARAELGALDAACCSELLTAYPLAKKLADRAGYFALGGFFAAGAASMYAIDLLHSHQEGWKFFLALIEGLSGITFLCWSILFQRRSEALSNGIYQSILCLRSPDSLSAKLELFHTKGLATGDREEFWQGIAESLQLSADKEIVLSREANNELLNVTRGILHTPYQKACQEQLLQAFSLVMVVEAVRSS